MYRVGVKQIVYISLAIIGSTFNIQSFLDYLTQEKTVDTVDIMSTWYLVNMSQSDMDIMQQQSILFCTF